MNIVPQSQFDETKLNFKYVSYLNHQDSPQYTILFNYKFPNGEEDQALILTDPIKVRGKGIPVVDGQWKINDNQCLDFFLNLDEQDGQLLKMQLIDKIDNKFQYLNGNANSNVKVGDKEVKKLRYTQCHRQIHDGNYIEGDDDEEDPTHMISRVKLQIDTVFDSHQTIDIPKKIKTTVFLPIDKTVQMKDIEFKSEPEVINCLDDLRQLFHFGCTVRMVLKVNRFWIQKAITHHDGHWRQCGITLKCMQIYVLHDPQWFQFNQNKPILMPGIKIAVKKPEPEDNDKVLLEESDDDKCECGDDEYDDDETEAPKYNPEKSIYEFDDEDEEEENPVPPKKHIIPKKSVTHYCK
jgi:hypothetical protein